MFSVPTYIFWYWSILFNIALQLQERLKERKLVGTCFVDCLKVIMKIKVVLTQSSTVAALPVSFQEETSRNMKDENIIILCLFRYLLLDVNSYLTTYIALKIVFLLTHWMLDVSFTCKNVRFLHFPCDSPIQHCFCGWPHVSSGNFCNRVHRCLHLCLYENHGLE